MLEFERVAATFAAAAATYERAAALPREVESRLLDRLRFLDLDIHRALDLGAGAGRGAVALADRLAPAEVVALDPARPLLALAEPVARTARVCADAGALPFAEASFELVYSNLVLPWCAEPGVVFTEVRRVLRSGGAFLFTTLGPDTLTELKTCWAACDDLPHVHPFLDMHLIGDALLEAGFKDPVMDREVLTLSYERVGALLRDLKEQGAVNLMRGRRRTLTGKSRFRAMLDGYEKRRAGDRVPATFEVVYGLAWGPPPGQPRRRDGMEIATFPVDHLKRRR